MLQAADRFGNRRASVQHVFTARSYFGTMVRVDEVDGECGPVYLRRTDVILACIDGRSGTKVVVVDPYVASVPRQRLEVDPVQERTIDHV